MLGRLTLIVKQRYIKIINPIEKKMEGNSNRENSLGGSLDDGKIRNRWRSFG
jgi:hypothetical protein